ncbi:MAG: alpha/beta hydrolase [Paracoccaceae bacterium]
MRTIGKWVGRLVLSLFFLGAGVWFLAPKEPVDREIAFQDSSLGADLDVWLAEREAGYPDIVPGVAKRIFWAGETGVKTPLAVIYIHGFSATSEEIRPVPDEVAKALGANLFYTRLAGHGRGSAAMSEPVAGDWIEDMAEAMAVGRKLGDRVVLIGTSTGGTLIAIAATDPVLSKDLAGVVLVSPNFRLFSPAAALLDMPLARWWGPVVAGAERSFEPLNAGQAQYWTTSYQTSALFPMAAAARVSRELDYGAAKMPALFVWSNEDKVIDPTAIAPVVAAWGGPVTQDVRTMQAGDDPYAHVIAGDIMAPGQTEAVVAGILAWAKGL